MDYKLSICIPTYNRASLLRECLDHLLPQIIKYNDVEVIVSDNASTDGTDLMIKEYLNKYVFLKYYRNTENLGYAGNQVKLLSRARGEYIAILCDDDVYVDGQVDNILRVISTGDYAFVALNYYSFIDHQVTKPYRSNYAPDRDVLFPRAFDVMNHPSVGHFSGFIFNAKLAKPNLIKMLSQNRIIDYENYRGLISELAVRCTTNTSLPAFFIGKRLLATRIIIGQKLDYTNINHLCMDYYEFWYGLYSEGVINKNDMKYRVNIVLHNFPRGIISDIYKLTNDEIDLVIKRIIKTFESKKLFYLFIPFIFIGRFAVIRSLYKSLHMLKKAITI